ncbi:YhcH/YjgK/YiaL family protein [Paenibacillus sp. UNCCL117]|uniref:YhcH/YjgK/YiaL family protein n=1 Tax=unclassified Paenibacillus TaxID=185978 RepID=UPI00088F27A4|nr:MULTISPECIES: YhcH/YjgK/YiaL family protein [unclassified Paenibacillus]SDD69721.1 YhcH/YjgK/YiaL family protein [Paenibacillus sp. cl123]SFW45194.1 YhcH/YjgK/YiaL family protein [Paenibacillus sp. UNCCL117]
MIFGDMRHYEAEKHTYPAVIRKGLEQIASLKLAEQEAGRYEIEEGLMFALVQEPVTKPAAEQKFESHEQHVDIQYLISGMESIEVVRHSSELTVAVDEMAGKDYVFYEEAEGASRLVLSPGQFAVFYPWDVHKPCCAAAGSPNGQQIKKVVIKIHKRLWDAASAE